MDNPSGGTFRSRRFPGMCPLGWAKLAASGDRSSPAAPGASVRPLSRGGLGAFPRRCSSDGVSPSAARHPTGPPPRTPPPLVPLANQPPLRPSCHCLRRILPVPDFPGIGQVGGPSDSQRTIFFAMEQCSLGGRQAAHRQPQDRPPYHTSFPTGDAGLGEGF